MSSFDFITKEYFQREVVRFRDIMCSTKYIIEQKDRAFEALGLVYLSAPVDENTASVFMATGLEWCRRRDWEQIRPRPVLPSKEG